MTESVDSKQGLYVFEDLTDEEIAREAEFYGDLTGSVRDLVELALSTESDDDDIRQAREHLEAAKALLSKRTRPQPYGVRWNAAGNRRAWGNAVVGLRNAVAPPLRIQREPDGRVWADVELGMQYEGPAGLTHGGISALLLDQVLGEAAEHGGAPGMTGTLTLRYRKPTPLGKLHLEACVDRIEGVKTFVTGHLAGPDGVCVEAEGVFILPRWARAVDGSSALPVPGPA
ncbi:thioesterase [Prescottella equi]|uniref:PaaI family thioesterase n=1 Tax=Rhodococcus hoagii TaxID=43767 RepID=UPI000A1147EA|nr:PaaI family thioesterase [Prescottella equi]ORL32573.1 thioesterase [Prescottella equi]ORL91058.1 thioesterase [Prescottella equi]ORM13943.1 thioesterase [Prescottella equi]ORM22946.1 thioesterase [Prescottella equi]